MDIRQVLSGALAGRYGLEAEMGRGGMATVFEAWDVRHERRVALKVLHPELTVALGRERFLREIRLVAGLQHPNIIAVHDSGEAGGLLFYVMPLIEGETLRRRLVRERRLAVDEATHVTREVADALGYAHARGIVHREVKPENILLSRSGHAVVADFGIAWAAHLARDERLTATGVSLGTPAYMAPEQALGEGADPPSAANPSRLSPAPSRAPLRPSSSVDLTSHLRSSALCGELGRTPRSVSLRRRAGRRARSGRARAGGNEWQDAIRHGAARSLDPCNGLDRGGTGCRGSRRRLVGHGHAQGCDARGGNGSRQHRFRGQRAVPTGQQLTPGRAFSVHAEWSGGKRTRADSAKPGTQSGFGADGASMLPPELSVDRRGNVAAAEPPWRYSRRLH